MVALGIFGALTKLKSAANDLPYTSQVALGLFGQCNAQVSKVAHSCLDPSSVKLKHPPRHTDLIRVTFKAVVDVKGKTAKGTQEGIFLQHNYTAGLYCCQLQ